MADVADSGAVVMPNAEALTPAQVVERLDRFIVGQDKAKRAVAVAPAHDEQRTPKPPRSSVT